MVRYKSAKRSFVRAFTGAAFFLPKVILVTFLTILKSVVSATTKVARRVHRRNVSRTSLRGANLSYRFGFVLIIPVVLILIIYSPLFRVKDVNIVWVDAQLLVPAVENAFKAATLEKNIFSISRQRLLKITKDTPVVSNISLSKAFPSRLSIEVKTRDPFLVGEWVGFEKEASLSALIKRDFFGGFIRQARISAESYLLDREGLVFWKNSKLESGLPLIFFVDRPTPVLGESVAGSQDKAGVQFVASLREKGTQGDFPTLSFMVSGEDTLLAKFDVGPYVFLPQQSSYSELLDSLKLILDKYHIEGKVLKKVDLRFNNPVVEY